MAETSTPESQEAVDLTKLTIQRLRTTASSLGVRGTNTMTKVALIEAIQEKESAAEKPEEAKPKTVIDLDDLAAKLGNRMAPTVAKALEDELNKAVARVCTAVWEAYQDLAKKEGKSVPPMPEDIEKLLKVVTALIAQVSLSIDRLAIVGTKVDDLEAAVAELLKVEAEEERKEEGRVPSQDQPWRQRLLRMSGKVWTSVAYYLWDPTARSATQSGS